jgi:hypothetical protein
MRPLRIRKPKTEDNVDNCGGVDDNNYNITITMQIIIIIIISNIWRLWIHALYQDVNILL